MDVATSEAALTLNSRGNDQQSASLTETATGYGEYNLYRHLEGTITMRYKVQDENARTQLLKLNSLFDPRWRVEEDGQGGPLLIRMPDDLESWEGAVIGALKEKLGLGVWESLPNHVKYHITNEYNRKVLSHDHRGVYKEVDADNSIADASCQTDHSLQSLGEEIEIYYTPRRDEVRKGLAQLPQFRPEDGQELPQNYTFMFVLPNNESLMSRKALVAAVKERYGVPGNNVFDIPSVQSALHLAYKAARNKKLAPANSSMGVFSINSS